MCYIGPYSTYSKEPGKSGCSVACLVTWFLHVEQLVFLHGFARFLHVEQLVFFHTWNCFFCMTRTACFFAFCMWNRRFFSHVEQLVFLHDMWNCKAPPCFFSCQAAVRGFILENLAVGRRGGAERALAGGAECRAGTSNSVPSRH